MCGAGVPYANAKALHELLQESRAENAKLREELAKWERLAAGIELPEYPVTQFKPKDLERENAKLRERIHELEMEGSDHFYRTAYAEDADRTLEVENTKLQAENAKLRELVQNLWPHVRHRPRMCGECELPCDTSDECLLYEPMRQRMRELRVEVDG